jgi:hypothetical protein
LAATQAMPVEAAGSRGPTIEMPALGAIRAGAS